MDRNLYLNLDENQVEIGDCLIFDNITSEGLGKITTPTDVLDINAFGEEMESLTKYLESETIVKELIEESEEEKVVEERIYVSPPAKKTKLDYSHFDEDYAPPEEKECKDKEDIDQEGVNDQSVGDWDNTEWDEHCEAECNMAEIKDDTECNMTEIKDDAECNMTEIKDDTECNMTKIKDDAESNMTEIKDDNTESWKKSIREGDDFQANIPEDLCPYDDPSLDHNEDKKLWEPDQITEDEVKEYLKQYMEAVGSGAEQVTEERWKEISSSWPKECENNTKDDMFKDGQVVDDEQALYLLHQCGYSTEEALRRAKLLRRLLLKQKYLAKKNCANVSF